MPAPVFKTPAKPAPASLSARIAQRRGVTTGRFPGNKINVAAKPKPGVTAEFGDLLKELESARLKKNAYSRAYSAAEKRIKEEFPDFDLDAFTMQLMAEDEEGKEVAVEVSITKEEGESVVETLDKAKLKKIVTPEIYDLCTVLQKGLIEEHAGGAVLKRVLTITREPLDAPVVTIKSEKVKAPKAVTAKKKAK